jgi:hypothetical protein
MGLPSHHQPAALNAKSQPCVWNRVETIMPHRRLRNYELQSLNPLLKSVADEAEQVVEQWHKLYAEQCGENRALGEEEFSNIMLPLVRNSVSALLGSEYERFGAIAGELGERLARRDVPS